MTKVAQVFFGYKIMGGSAHVFHEEAHKVRKLFENYLFGLSLKNAAKTAAKTAGIDVYHGTAGRMLRNKKYLGDDFYPAIVEPELFLKAETERKKRAKSLGRVFKTKPESKGKIATDFVLGQITKEYSDPFWQAKYLYSLIKERGSHDGG